jgi:putative membrane protein
MSTPNYDQSKLASIKTYMLVAFIFNIIGMIAFGLLGIWEIITWATWSGYDYFGVLAGYSTGLLITGIVLLVFFVFALLIFMRVRKMYTAVNRGDIATLKSLNNMMWAILALIFTGVITGVMLLISFGPINELGQAPGAYPPPPPPS